jgi:ketosteroid isomerase-like protein
LGLSRYEGAFLKIQRVALILIPFMFVIAALVPARAQDDNATVTAKIAAMEKAWNQAFKMRDANALNALLAEEAVLVNDDGSLEAKSGFLKGIREAKASDEQQVTPESIDVHVFGNVAVATGVFRLKGVENGKAFSRKDRFADTWLRKGDSWVCISASATAVAK